MIYGQKKQNYHTISVVLFLPNMCTSFNDPMFNRSITQQPYATFSFSWVTEINLDSFILTSWNPNKEHFQKHFSLWQVWSKAWFQSMQMATDGWLPLTLFAGSSHSMLVDFNPALFPGQAWTWETHFTGKLERSVSTAVQTSQISSFETAPRMDDGHETV